MAETVRVCRDVALNVRHQLRYSRRAPDDLQFGVVRERLKFDAYLHEVSPHVVGQAETTIDLGILRKLFKG